MMEKNSMTTRQSSTTAEGSLGRDALYAARYYLGNRWTLLALGALAVVLGLTFGGWAWLVAAGLAPVILSTLPCLIMCGFGLCMMCRSGKKESATPPSAVDAATSASALGIAKMNGPPIAGPSCCHEDSHGNPTTALAEDSATEWKEKPHA
jgi:hypothetical protein